MVAQSLGRFRLGLLALSLVALLLEVLAAELDQLRGVGPDYLLREVLQDCRQVLGHLDLVRLENSHLSHVSHLYFSEEGSKGLS